MYLIIHDIYDHIRSSSDVMNWWTQVIMSMVIWVHHWYDGFKSNENFVHDHRYFHASGWQAYNRWRHSRKAVTSYIHAYIRTWCQHYSYLALHLYTCDVHGHAVVYGSVPAGNFLLDPLGRIMQDEGFASARLWQDRCTFSWRKCKVVVLWNSLVPFVDVASRPEGKGDVPLFMYDWICTFVWFQTRVSSLRFDSYRQTLVEIQATGNVRYSPGQLVPVRCEHWCVGNTSLLIRFLTTNWRIWWTYQLHFQLIGQVGKDSCMCANYCQTIVMNTHKF